MFFLPFFRASRLNGIEEFVIALFPIYRYFITTFVTFVNWNLAPVFAGVLIDTSTRWISIYSMRASNFFFFPLTMLFRIDLARYESIGADVSHRICLGRRRPRRFLSRLVFPFVFHGCAAAVCRLKTWRAEIQRNTQGFPFRTAFPYVRDSYVGEARDRRPFLSFHSTRYRFDWVTRSEIHSLHLIDPGFHLRCLPYYFASLMENNIFYTDSVQGVTGSTLYHSLYLCLLSKL